MLRPEALAVVRVLAQLSPQETAYFLRQLVVTEKDKNIEWLIRKTLPEFPEETAANLKKAIGR